MKLLHREDVEEAGYAMPIEGLCANIDEINLDALKFAGEWVLADDEILVADGQQQNFLYLVISGEVGIYKRNDQGQSQFIASLGQGEAFGEMAFLSGGVASADVQASGEGILWRIDHERMLEFIGQGGPAGGQLCLNIASILSNRLVDGNRKVVDMGKELQASLHQLKQASQTGSTKDQALRQMQGKVKGMQDAFKGQSVKKSSFGWPAIAATIVAVLSLTGLTVSLVTGGGGETAVGDSKLQNKVDELTENEEFYQGLKARLESQNETLKSEKTKLSKERADLLAQVSESMGKDAELNQLKRQLSDVERRLASASKSTVASPATAVASSPTPSVRPAPTPSESPNDDAKVVAWALKNSTLVFPLHIKGKKMVTLQDRTQQVKIPVPSGSALKALRFHHSAPAVLIVSQPTSDKFLAIVSIADTNFAEAVRPRYLTHQRKVTTEANPLLSNPAATSFRPKPSSVAGASPGPKPSLPVKTSSPETPVVAGKSTPGITTGRPLQPQKPANILDSVATKPATRPDPRKPKSKAENDHGTACVCKDCRGKKAGKSSLFDDF
jgi:CRP-like cAMP-binding protein